MKTNLIILWSIIFLTSNCGKKEDIQSIDQLPPVTTKGKNTFGCLINGEPWVAHIENNPIVWGEDVVDAQYDDEEYLLVKAIRKNEEINLSQYFSLHCNAYSIDSSSLRITTRFADFRGNCNDFYKIDTLSSNSLNILRLDTDNKIISGKFNLTMIATDCNDTLRVTEGRFDVPYHY